MAKKKAKHHSAARATPAPETPGAHISIDEALHRLLAAYQAHFAVERLNAALRENTVRLWCNGNLLSPNYIRAELVVQAGQDADGRWRAEVVPAQARIWEERSYRWEVNPTEVSTLLPRARSKRGPKYTDDWPTEVARWLIKVARDDPNALTNISKLARRARGLLQQQGVFVPVDDDDKALRGWIAKLLR